MLRYLAVVLMFTMVLLSACASESRSGGTQSEVRGPAHGFVAVPAGTGHWTASEATAEKTARSFVLGPKGECDCSKVTVQIGTKVGNRAVVQVILHGLKDDSVGDVEYQVEVVESEAGWKVERANYRVKCRRGVTDAGLCV